MTIENNKTRTEFKTLQLPQEEKICERATNTIHSSEEFMFYPAIAISAIFAGKAVLADTFRKTALLSCGAIVSALTIQSEERAVDLKSSKERLFVSQLPIFAGTALTAVFVGRAVLAKGIIKTAKMSLAAMTSASVIVPASTFCLNPDWNELRSFAKKIQGAVSGVNQATIASIPTVSTSTPDIKPFVKKILENIGNSNTFD